MSASEDLLLVAASSVAAVAVTVFPVPDWVTALVAVPFLLMVPGYAILSALFPFQVGRYGGEEFSAVDVPVLSVATSIAAAIVVGVNLGFTPVPIDERTVVGSLALISLVASGLSLAQRATREGPTPARRRTGRLRGTSQKPGLFDRVEAADIVVVFAVLVALASVALVAGTPQRGETYTELGLLTENESGDLVATGYPEDLSPGEAASLHFTVENSEQETVDYGVVVQLAAVGPNGTVTDRQQVGIHRNRLAAGENWVNQHNVTPLAVRGQVRLSYLLYRGDVPDQPTTENAYRETHLWLTVGTDAADAPDN